MARKNGRIRRFAAFLMTCTVAVQMLSGSIVLAAEVGDTSITATITVASNKSKQEMQSYLDAFNKKYPGIEIDYNYYSDYETEIGKDIESGDYPDVLFVPGSIGADKYADYFEPLGTRKDLDNKYNYLEGSKVKKDIIYGIPSSAYVNGILYNKAVFEKAGITDTPKSIDEFLMDLYMIKERTTAIPFYTNYAANWTLTAWEQYPFLAMTGDPDYRSNGFVNEADPFLTGTTHYKVYKLLYDIVSNGLCESDPSKSDWEQSKLMLNNGKVASMAIGSWALKQVQDVGNNSSDVAYMPFPNEVDGKQYMTIVADYCYGINKNSEQKTAARDYIDFMLDESGYALDNEVLSVVKTDPIPETYGDMNNVVCKCDNEASDDNYNKKQILSANLNILDSTDEVKRVIEAADGTRDETFDQIAEDWNERWESSRTDDMKTGTSSHVTVLNSALSRNYDVEFSDTEQDYLKNLKEIKVGYLKNMAPFQYYADGQFQGVLKNIMDIISKDIDVPIVEKGYDNTEQMTKALHNGDIDMIAGMNKSSKYGTDLKYSTECMDVMKVMVKSDSKKSNDALKGSMAQIDGEDYSDIQTDATDTVEVSSLAESLEKIEKLKADFTISDYNSVYYYAQEQGFKHLDITPISANAGLYLAYTKGCDTRLISVCNKILYSIPNENKQIMLDKCMKSENQQITLKRFIECNTIACLIAVIVFFALIILAVVYMARQRARIAKIDALSGLYNRYGIRDSMRVLYEKKHFPMVIAILDIDNFKSVNDTLGHLGGDEALRLLANTMKHVFGNKVVLGRYGGDEFVIGFHMHDIDDSHKKFDELVNMMDKKFEFEGSAVDLSISLGAVIVEEDIPYDDLFKVADYALYEVKKSGKNDYKLVYYKDIKDMQMEE